MTSKSNVYIAGVGSTSTSSGDNLASLVSAATKALLDAGLSYDDVTHGIRSKNLSGGSEAFQAFDESGVSLKEVGSGTELDAAFDLVNSKGAQCVLLLAAEKSHATAIVLVSGTKLWRHSFLKDSSIRISSSSTSQKQTNQGYGDISKPVWALRGWSDQATEKGGTLTYKNYEFSRADKKDVPKWKEVEHRPDGKHRLRYNPATESKETFLEDFEAVRAAGKDRNKIAERIKFKRVGGDRAALAKL